MFEGRVAVVLLWLSAGAVAFAAEPPERDPTQPFSRTPAAAIAAGTAAPRFVLTAVLISPTRRVAVLNGRPYLAGEVVDGAEIVAIDADSVRMRDGGTELVVSLGRPESGRQSVQGDTVP